MPSEILTTKLDLQTEALLNISLVETLDWTVTISQEMGDFLYDSNSPAERERTKFSATVLHDFVNFKGGNSPEERRMCVSVSVRLH